MQLSDVNRDRISAALNGLGFDADDVDQAVVYYEPDNGDDLHILVATGLALLDYLQSEVHMSIAELTLREVVRWADVQVGLTTATRWDARGKTFVTELRLDLGDRLRKLCSTDSTREEYEGIRDFAALCLRRSVLASAGGHRLGTDTQ